MASQTGASSASTTAAPQSTNAGSNNAARVLEEGPGRLVSAFDRELSLSSRSIHADDYINTHRAVAPPMHVSTTFRYSRNPDEMVPWKNTDVREKRNMIPL